MSKFFAVPNDSLINLPPPTVVTPTGDYHFAYDALLFWGQADQGSRQIVVMSFKDPDGEGTKDYIALDGEWRQQLESCVGGCNGGGPSPTPGGALRVGYAGLYQPDISEYTEISFPTAGDWVDITSDVLLLESYAAEDVNEMLVDLAANTVRLTWVPPVPASPGFGEITVVWNVASVGNDQTYEFGVKQNGVVRPPGTRTMLDYERAGDVETLVMQGHGEMSDGDVFQLVVRNVTDTNPLRLYGLNWRTTVTSQNA